MGYSPGCRNLTELLQHLREDELDAEKRQMEALCENDLNKAAYEAGKNSAMNWASRMLEFFVEWK